MPPLAASKRAIQPPTLPGLLIGLPTEPQRHPDIAHALQPNLDRERCDRGILQVNRK
jgi:hypothetical protein